MYYNNIIFLSDSDSVYVLAIDNITNELIHQLLQCMLISKYYVTQFMIYNVSYKIWSLRLSSLFSYGINDPYPGTNNSLIFVVITRRTFSL